MAILSRDDFFKALQEKVGTDNSEESIAFLENMGDTYNALEKRANGDGVDWKQRYNELDETWRKRYQHRFFSGGDIGFPNNPSSNAEETDTAETIQVDDLFKEKE